MSSKRNRSKARSKKDKADAIPAEILAEGSGPNEVVDATPQTLVEAAEELVDKRKGRKRKGKAALQDDAAEPVVAAETSEDSEFEATEADSEETLEASENGEEGEAAEVDAAADVDAELEASADGEGNADATSDENPDEALAFDAAADNVPDTTLTNEGEAVAAVEDAIMRAEAEAELGSAEDIDGEAGEEGEGAALPTTAATMDAAQLKNLVEALVFAADKPVTLQRLRQLTRVGDVKRLEQALTELAADYTNRGLVLQQVSGGYQFRTNTQYSVWVQQLIAGRPVRLSRAQLETLAIVAYRQPITRPEIDEIRGVDSSATLRLLLDRSLIRTLGKKEDVGRPMLYGTTKEFLDFFSLGDLRELPTLREYSELTAESRKVMTDRLGVDPGAEPANDETATEEAVEAKPTVEVDAWGQVINVPEEPATDTSASSEASDTEVAADADASGETELSASDVDASSETDSSDSDSDSDESAELSDDGDDGDGVAMSASTEASTDSDESAETPRVLVDAWGQPISTDDDESDEMSASGEEQSASEESSSDESSPADEMSASEESSSDETSTSEEMSASEEASSEESDADGAMSASGENVSAEPDEMSTSEESSSESDEMSASEESSSDETSTSDEMSASGEDVSAETDDVSASEELSSETEFLGAPAGGTMEDRIDLAGSETDQGDLDAASDDDTSAESDGDDESLEASADVVAAEKLDASDDESGDEPSRD